MHDLTRATPDELMAELRTRYDALVFIACQAATGHADGDWVYDSKGDPFRLAGLAHAAQLREERCLAVMLASAGALPGPHLIRPLDGGRPEYRPEGGGF